MRRFRLLVLPIFLLLGGCGSPQETPSAGPFLPPTLAAAPTAAASAAPSQIPASPTPECVNNLVYLEDLTVPDGSSVAPGESIDKRWRVSNSGTCNWDETYSLILITGTEMGSASPQSLYPALSGTEAIIRILFTAPGESGTYRSAWQAVGPSGEPFGDPVFIEIVVS